jgi:hypothetical protein
MQVILLEGCAMLSASADASLSNLAVAMPSRRVCSALFLRTSTQNNLFCSASGTSQPPTLTDPQQADGTFETSILHGPMSDEIIAAMAQRISLSHVYVDLLSSSLCLAPLLQPAYRTSSSFRQKDGVTVLFELHAPADARSDLPFRREGIS